MTASRAAALSYAAAFTAAALLHLGLAAALGGALRAAADRAPAAQAAPTRPPLTVRLRRPQAPPAATLDRQPVVQTAPQEPPPVPGPTRPAVAEEPAPAAGPEQSREQPVPPIGEPTPAAAAVPAAEKPRPLRPIDAEAAYPLGARLRGEEGAVRLLLRIDAGGRLEGLRVIQSSGYPSLDQAAERAVRRSRFAPATLEGRPVSGELSVTIRFRLDS